MKKIFSIAACLVLVVSLALPAFAAVDYYEITATNWDVDLVSHPYIYFHASLSGENSLSMTFLDNVSADIVVDDLVLASGRGSVRYKVSGGGFTEFTVSDVGTVLEDVVQISLSTFTGTSATLSVKFHVFSTEVSPPMASPISNGSYSVIGLDGVYSDSFMYTLKSQPKTFVFSDVTANTGMKVSYAITAEGGSVTYHDIGTLEDGFTFASADYPVASYFTVRNTGSTPASYTVTVSDAAIDKSSGIALSIWETCLTMGTSMIAWITTGTNFIALIPIAMMLLVFAVLCIRKLIKGV